MKVNYNSLIYKSGLCNLDNIKEFKRISNEVNEIISFFDKKTDVNEDFVKIIILSYKYEPRRIMVKNRINLIRGMVYSKHYVDFSDIDSFLELLTINNNYHDLVNGTMWTKIELDQDYLVSIKDLMKSDDDIIYTANRIMDRIELNKKLYGDLLNKEKNILNSSKNTTTEELDKDDEEDEDIDEYRSEMTITPEDKLLYFSMQYPEYKKEILKVKNINDKNEKKFVILGMDLWFKLIINELGTIYEINKNAEAIKFKNLHLSI